VDPSTFVFLKMYKRPSPSAAKLLGLFGLYLFQF
jgi:hypothetical protein